MRYFKIEVKVRYPESKRIASGAEGDKIPLGENYFRKMDMGEELINAPGFNFFYLKSFDKERYWEWQLNDVHSFIGEGSRIPGWLISEKMKNLLENFEIAKPHFYYPAKLLFEGEKLNYYIFQFSGTNFREPLTRYINFSRSLFYDPTYKRDFNVENEKELSKEQERILKESEFNVVNVPIKTLALNEDIDFISMQNFLGDRISSERLKQVIEEQKITGFEFSELDYKVII